MQRYLFISVGWFALAIGMAHAVPARPLYEPPEPPKAPPALAIVDLRNTAWLGKYSAANRTFVFEADGTISYKSSTVKAAKAIKNRGHWSFDGVTVTFEHNMGAGKVMDFRGTILDANTIVGESILKTGARSSQTMKRTALPVK